MVFNFLFKEEMNYMDPKKFNLKQAANEVAQTDRIVARLEGELDDKTVQLWGEEFAASGGKPPPQPQPEV